MQNNKRYLSYTLGTLGTIMVTAAIFAIVSACSDEQAKAKPNFIFKDSTKAGVVAKINGEDITEEMLIGSEKMPYFEIKKREYDFRMGQLNKLLVEKLIGGEAKKANMNTEDFIKKNVTKGDIKILDKEYKAFVAEKKIPESQINPQIKERINQYLERQKKDDLVNGYIAKLTKGSPVEVYFSKPKSTVTIDAGNGPFAGGKDAKVTIIEFSDFQCPFCSRAAETVNQVKKKYGNKIKLVFRHFPLPMHREARPAAEASLCMNDQSTDKFWKFHDAAFKAQDKLDAPGLEAHAKAAGADLAKFKECLAAKKFAAAVQADMTYGEKMGIQSTPTFFVNGQILNGAVPLEQFSEIIDEELAALK